MSEANAGRMGLLLAGVLIASAVRIAPGVGSAVHAQEPAPVEPDAPVPPGFMAHTPERLAAQGSERDAGGSAVSIATGECPGPITEDLTLTADLACSLDVLGSGITIDLGGHTLTGRIAGGSMTIRNGTVDGAGVRPFAGVIFAGSGSLIEGVEVRNGASWTMILPGANSTVRNSRFINNRSVVFDLWWGSRHTIENNLFVGNGIAVSNQLGNDHKIQRNFFVDNATGVGFWNEDHWGVSNNVVRNNVFLNNQVGVSLVATEGRRHPDLGAMDNNEFRDNVFFGNTLSGMRMRLLTCGRFFPLVGECPAQGTRIEGNVLAFNGSEALEPDDDDGLHVTPDPNWAGFFTLKHNKALFNADLGIEADGVIDGGRNLGLLNRDPRQCVGVRCAPGRPWR